MAKKNNIRKLNNTFNTNLYWNGGDVLKNAFNFKDTFSAASLGNMAKGAAGAIGSAVGGAANSLISGGLQSGAGSAISGIGNTIGGVVGAVNPVLGGVISIGSGIIGGVTNALFGSKLNEEKINEIEESNKGMNTLILDASSNDAIESQWANLDFGSSFSKDDIGKDGLFSNKAKNEYKRLRRELNAARNRAYTSYSNAASAADINADLNALSNFYSNGGLMGEPNEFLDWWNQSRFNTSRYNEQLGSGNLEVLKASRDSALLYKSPMAYGVDSYLKTTPVVRVKGDTRTDIELELERRKRAALFGKATKNRLTTPTLYGTISGEYNPKAHTIYYTDDTNKLHEQAHASKALPLEKVIEGIIKDKKSDYYDKPTEVYSRLMLLREANLIDPSQVWDKGMLKEFKKSATDFNILNRYDDNQVLDLFNKVASTNSLLNNSLTRLSAYGGPLLSGEDNMFSSGGSIHIKPSKRGTFTAAAKKHGKSVLAFASLVLANKDNYSPAMVKKANFARNAAKWHSDGGPLMSNGAEWYNGLTYINNGSTHENNIYEGVPIGMDSLGIPNLVEEGEVVWNDYVFSNRLTVPKAARLKYRLRNNKEITFADAAKKMAKESEERPNDPISKRGLNAAMERLLMELEIVRLDMAGQEEKRKYAVGGTLGNLFANGGDKSLKMAKAKAKRQGYNVGESLEDYLRDPIYEGGESDKEYDLSWLRYAPVAGSAIGLALNLFSKPDYSNADTILEAANSAGNYMPIDYTPIGNYLQYRPFDRNFYLNKLNAQAGATRRAIMNTTSPSRNAALLAADYNAQGRLGDLARQAEEYNLAQRQAVETFNRGTNMANAEMGLKAAMANQEAALKARSSRLSGVAQAMAMRDAIDNRRSAGMSANLTNLFDSLGNIGIDAYNREDRDKLIRAGVFGTLSEKPQEWSNKRWEDYKKAVSGTGYRNGGKLKKKRGGFTY